VRVFLRANVRFNRDLGEFEMRCDSCATKRGSRYWPLTTEFWSPGATMLMCRACVLEKKSLARKADRRPRHEANRTYYRENRDLLRIKQADYYRANREQRLAYMVEYNAINRDRINAQKRAKYADLSIEQRRERRRVQKRDHMRRVRAEMAA
jgi:hypothetical protein